MTDSSIISTTSTRAPPFSALNTTAGSVLHILSRALVGLGFGAATPVALYAGAVSVTFLPLMIVGWFSPLSMTVRSSTLQMPFFYDANNIFMYVVSFPCLLIMTVTDDQMLSRALSTVWVDGTVTISEAYGMALTERWRRLFRITNLAAQALGLAVGGVVACFIFIGSTTETVGSWVAYDKHLQPAGYIFLYCAILFSAVATIFVSRSIAVAVLLRDIVAHAELHNPDKAGGLQPIGRLGLRNQYALTLLGLNIVLAILVTYFFVPKSNHMIELLAIATIAYLVVGPLVFVAPLLPFRGGMIRSKAQLMNGVAVRLRVELDNVRSRFQSGAITEEDEQMIERLRKIGAVIDDLPVWPFDAGTLRKFFTAYVIPIAGSLSVPVAKAILPDLHGTIPALD
jgi:hypothetical protein